MWFFRDQSRVYKLITIHSFLAILCGENGEKVELFAGTYRTTLGLSRTFILPDSPRSLELQLQGDDLVEVLGEGDAVRDEDARFGRQDASWTDNLV